jgi:spore coat polysaccharide biosynthesis protein SpsF (cytidylyltransferase family)
VHRGPLEDVLGRFAAAARAARLDVVARVSGDSPLLDPALVDLAFDALAAGGWDAVSNVVGQRTFPAGQSVEAMTIATLGRLEVLTTDPADREHVTPLLYRRPDLFTVLPVRRTPAAPAPHLAVDTPDDLARVAAIVERMRRPHWSYGLDEVIGLADAA